MLNVGAAIRRPRATIGRPYIRLLLKEKPFRMKTHFFLSFC